MIELLPEYKNSVVKSGRSWYDVDGVRHVRVTTALNVISKPALVPWAIRETTNKMRAVMEASVNTTIDPVWIEEALQQAKNYPDEARDAAAAKGTAIHEAIYNWETIGERPDDAVENQAVQAYDEWRTQVPMEVVAS